MSVEFLVSIIIVLTCACIYNIERYKFKSSEFKKRHPHYHICGESLRSCYQALEWAGIFTYSLYVWHSPVMIVLQKIPPDSMALWYYYIRFIGVLTLLLILSAGSYFLIERPFEKMKVFKTPQEKA